MRLLIPLLFIIIFNNASAQNYLSVYDAGLTRIVSSFKENIKNKTECEDLKREAYFLQTNIEKSIENDNLDLKEKKQLESLLKEVESLQEFIGTIANAGNNMFVDMKHILIANERINASIAKISNYNFCIDIYQVTLNGFSSTIAYNYTSNNYSISYKWKSPNGSANGSGTMGLPSKSMRHILDNRDHKNYNTIKISSIICKDISTF
jgi:hypothetical protein